MNLGELLRGTQPDKVQTVGIMQVLPLVSEYNDDRFASFKRAYVSTSDYGTLVFRNQEDNPMLIPKDAAYVTKQRTQDHALPHVGFIEQKSTQRFTTAACNQ